MTDSRNDCERISRRVVVTGTALALAAAVASAVIPPAEAQEKMSQADAKYQDTPKGDQRCDGCMLFEAPNACKVVEGQISPSAWCQLFVKKT
jgi:hypothetical protein